MLVQALQGQAWITRTWEGTRQSGQSAAWSALGLQRHKPQLRKPCKRKVPSACQDLLHIFGSTSFLASCGYLAHLKLEKTM